MNQLGPLPWRLTFSYGRALQTAALLTWNGKAENVAAAQKAFAHRARMNALASAGRMGARARPGGLSAGASAVRALARPCRRRAFRRHTPSPTWPTFSSSPRRTPSPRPLPQRSSALLGYACEGAAPPARQARRGRLQGAGEGRWSPVAQAAGRRGADRGRTRRCQEARRRRPSRQRRPRPRFRRRSRR